MTDTLFTRDEFTKAMLEVVKDNNGVPGQTQARGGAS